MSGFLLPVEAPRPGMACWFIQLDDVVLEVDVDEGVKVCIW